MTHIIFCALWATNQCIASNCVLVR